MGAPGRRHRWCRASSAQVPARPHRPAGRSGRHRALPASGSGRLGRSRGPRTRGRGSTGPLSAPGHAHPPAAPPQAEGGGRIRPGAGPPPGAGAHRLGCRPCEGDGRVERAVLARLGPNWNGCLNRAGPSPPTPSASLTGSCPASSLHLQLGAPAFSRPDQLEVGIETDATMGTCIGGLFVAGELAGSRRRRGGRARRRARRTLCGLVPRPGRRS